MVTEIKVAIIAILWVFISVIFSFFISRYQASIKIKEIKAKYSHSLYDKRLDSYPYLYQITGSLGTLLRENKPDPESLRTYYEDLIDWDQKNAVFTGAKVTQQLSNTRNCLSICLNATRDISNFRDLYQSLIELEYELKRELGVFSAEDFDKIEKNHIKDIREYESHFKNKA